MLGPGCIQIDPSKFYRVTKMHRSNGQWQLCTIRNWHDVEYIDSSLVQQGILEGKYDDLPEQTFYMVGWIDEVLAKAEKLAKKSGA